MRMPRAFFAVSQPAAASIANLEKPDAAHWHAHDLQLPGWNMKSLPDPEAHPTFVPYTGTGTGVDSEHAQSPARAHAHAHSDSEPRHRRRRRLEYALFTSLSLLFCLFVLRWMSSNTGGGDSSPNANPTAEDPQALAAPPSIRVADASLLETSMLLELVGIGGFIGTALFVLRCSNKREQQPDLESAVELGLEGMIESESGKSTRRL
ncbi:hypothetical protein HMN09_01117000 [Mycena chlorophos]|uniref:Transmembrane protein n=1 Tax=Mycena chlorophos TaxID=658473 RepID=A0A8H6SB66_MYCCL|nr:hypothetical protein HMN09_01117000 [Mycena chlorophos]